MKTSHAVLAGTLLTAAALVYSIVLYPSLPDRIPIHWNLNGQIDGWGGKGWGVFGILAVMALFTLGILGLPRLSTRAFSVNSFRGTFNYVMVVCVALFGYMHWVMLQAALHPNVNFGKNLMVGLYLFLGLIGNMLGKVRRNEWMGVRTPWTLSSDRVWNATHRMAGHWMVGGCLFGAVSLWLDVPVWVGLSVLTVALFIPVFYSYYLFKQYEREEENSAKA